MAHAKKALEDISIGLFSLSWYVYVTSDTPDDASTQVISLCLETAFVEDVSAHVK